MHLFQKKPKSVSKTALLNIHWSVEDPFTFVSHHLDTYPKGNAQMAPPLELIRGRNLGRDYQQRFGFRMYHGRVVPGFPMHAHWGYETITIAEKGFVDHFDTEMNHGRFGDGDMQWTLASSKYEHNEMYPLLDQENDNPVQITQIVVNIPLERKNQGNSVRNVWSEDIPEITGDGYRVTVYCGEYGGKSLYSPNENSWAVAENGVRILRIVLDAGASLTFDPAADGVTRNVYQTEGKGARLDSVEITEGTRLKVKPGCGFTIEAGKEPAVFWLLEGKPIGQTMAQFGPVILDNIDNVRAAMDDIRKNEFQEWKWGVMDVTNPLDMGREFHRADGSVEYPPRNE